MTGVNFNLEVPKDEDSFDEKKLQIITNKSLYLIWKSIDNFVDYVETM